MTGRRAGSIALFALAASVAARAGAQARAPESPGRAILVRGADPIRGLPFFPPNALSALVGVYAPEGTADTPDETKVWFTHETLVLGAAWERTNLGGPEAYLLARPQGAVLALKSAQYYLFFELPAGAAPDDQSRLSFIRAFDRKFQAFFTNATTDAELSFPAYVDY